MVENKFKLPPKDPPASFALVLPGAVARGAYEAGVIEVLVQKKFNIERIVATSSGALNGLALAAGIRAGCAQEMTAKLVACWIENGGWENSFNLNPLSFFRGNGLSGRDELMRMMQELVKPCTSDVKYEIEFMIIVTPLRGIESSIGKKPATTYEHVMEFTGKDFDSAEGLQKIFMAVSAACAFPGLFKPVDLEGLGPCVDGGAVNNAPIRYALRNSELNRVLIPVPAPAVLRNRDHLQGLDFVSHLIEILINERLYRDLKIAQAVNRQSDKLKNLMDEGILSATQLEKVRETLSIRNIEITEIRPKKELSIGAFAGFFHKQNREQLVQLGREAAHEILSQLPAENLTGAQTT